MIIMVRKRGILKMLGTVAAAGVFAAALFAGVNVAKEKSVNTVADGNWGLSFQQEGEAPVANATAEYLAEYNAFYAEKTDKKVLYLTFDAGYENGYTGKILDVLKKHNVKATFFLVGNYIETSPDLVKRMVKEGHLVAITHIHIPICLQYLQKSNSKKSLISLKKSMRKSREKK